jgi:hypothetical protein
VAYNPFKKPIGEQLDLSDLQVLIELGEPESFYIEYKSDFPKPNKIARTIASFANTYGGWYFVGIDTDPHNRAVVLCGFENAKYNDPLATFLDAARQSLSHMPLVFPQIIQLSQSHSILAAYIPEGTETPYITKDGGIYRRAADATDPVAENNRYSVDRLVDRGRQEQERFNKFCTDDRTFSDTESNIAWINIYFQPRPRGLIDIQGLVTLDGVRTLIDKSKLQHTILKAPQDQEQDMTASLPFDTGYPSGKSVTLK